MRMEHRFARPIARPIVRPINRGEAPVVGSGNREVAVARSAVMRRGEAPAPANMHSVPGLRPSAIRFARASNLTVAAINCRGFAPSLLVWGFATAPLMRGFAPVFAPVVMCQEAGR